MIVIFEEQNRGLTVYVPVAAVSHWTLTREGGLCLWTTSSQMYFPSDKGQLLSELERVGLLPQGVLLPRGVPEPPVVVSGLTVQASAYAAKAALKERRVPTTKERVDAKAKA